MKEKKKIPPALSELPAKWPCQFSQKGWLERDTSSALEVGC